jgi:copper chaperone
MLNDLGLTDKNASTGGCACGCGGHDQKATAANTGLEQAAGQASAVPATTTAELRVTGMTCGHCVSSVTEELSALDGVESVDVQLNAGGVSTVTITGPGAAVLDRRSVEEAIAEAGYALAGAASDGDAD